MAHPLPYRGPLYIFSGGRIPGWLFKTFGGSTSYFAFVLLLGMCVISCPLVKPPLLFFRSSFTDLKVARVVTKGIEKYPGKECNMGRTKTIPENWQEELDRIRPYEPAPTVEGRESQLVNLAIGLTEYRMLTNTASSAEICQYLKLGTSLNTLEAEKLRLENSLTSRKITKLEAEAESELQNAEVIAALKRCRGEDDGYFG